MLQQYPTLLEIDDILEEIGDDLDPERSNADNGANYARREELLYYLSELVDTTIN